MLADQGMMDALLVLGCLLSDGLVCHWPGGEDELLSGRHLTGQWQ